MLLKNLEAIEADGTQGTHTHTFLNTSRKITITNDSTASDMGFKFQASREYATLHPTETISMDMTAKKIFIEGNAEHRIWVWG